MDDAVHVRAELRLRATLPFRYFLYDLRWLCSCRRGSLAWVRRQPQTSHVHAGEPGIGRAGRLPGWPPIVTAPVAVLPLGAGKDPPPRFGSYHAGRRSRREDNLRHRVLAGPGGRRARRCWSAGSCWIRPRSRPGCGSRRRRTGTRTSWPCRRLSSPVPGAIYAYLGRKASPRSPSVTGPARRRGPAAASVPRHVSFSPDSSLRCASGHEKMRVCGLLAPGWWPSFLQSRGHLGPGLRPVLLSAYGVS